MRGSHAPSSPRGLSGSWGRAVGAGGGVQAPQDLPECERATPLPQLVPGPACARVCVHMCPVGTQGLWLCLE